MKTRLLATMLATTALCLVPAASAVAGPVLRLDSVSNTAATPGGTIRYLLRIHNDGNAATNAPVAFSAHLPAGLSALDLSGLENCNGDGPGIIGAHNIECTVAATFGAHNGVSPKLTATVEPGAPPIVTSTFSISGGGSAPDSTADFTRVSETPTPFGVDGFDAEADSAAGDLFTQAAGHPYGYTTNLDFNTVSNPQHAPSPDLEELWPVEPTKDVIVHLPPGFVGNPSSASRCTSFQLANGSGFTPMPLCPPAAQVGTVLLRFNVSGSGALAGPYPIFNMVPPPSAPARFGFNVLGTVVTFNASLRSGSDYGISVDVENVSEGLDLAGSEVVFWGVGADSSHDEERACPGIPPPGSMAEPITCPNELPPRPFFRNPTSCTGPLITTAQIDSWFDPGSFDAEGEPVEEAAWQGASTESHQAPGYPFAPEEWGPPVGIEKCGEVPFEPALSVQPTTHEADSPTGLDVHLSLPQGALEEPEATAQSDLRTTEVTLPAGMAVNPAAAGGQNACTASQIGLKTPVGATPAHFDKAEPSCPNGSKLGAVKLQTPLIARYDDEGKPVEDEEGRVVPETLEGAVYLAKQGDNPFKSLLAIYIVVKGPGFFVKLPGKVIADPQTGRLETVVDSPQLPFSDLRLELFGGPRAALITPPACGTYRSAALMTPWSGGPPVEISNPFQLTHGPGNAGCPSRPPRFAPRFDTGSENPVAGAFSPFKLRLSREDGEQRFAGLTISTPPGLSGKLAGIPYCSDAILSSIPTIEGTGATELANPSCPVASRVGTNTAAVGAGSLPYYIGAPVYLAGPYKGAPLSLAILTPVVAGPFDLGNVLVRVALYVNPETAQLTAVSDPLPTIVDGIPTDIRSTETKIDRPNFTLNPTSCNPMSVGGTVTGTEGATANVSNRFQVGGCEALAFKPKLALRFTGETKRSGDPALHTTLTMPPGGANIAKARVTLPKGELIDNAHINNPCTRVQFAADECPPTSILGYARAYSPLLDNPLEGPVYFRSNGGARELPDLVADLNGQIHVTLVGFIDAKNERIRNTFAVVPDAPVSKFTLRLFGGKRGLLENEHDLCKTKNRASVEFDAQNGKVHDSETVIKVRCGKRRQR